MVVGGVVLVERHGARVDITLNRPERRNAITQELAVALRDAFLGLDADVGCVLLRGAGGSFCSGIDLKAAGDDLKNEPLTEWTSVHAAIYKCKAPVIVALERHAINAGAALALSADVVVAGEGSFLQVGEIAMGVPAPMCQAWLHLRHSVAVADRITLVGDRIGAADLLRMGVVSEVTADDRVIQRAIELADVIAGHPTRGRAGVSKVWRTLRGEIEDPDRWFASLAGR